MDYSLAQQLPIDILHRVTQELGNSALEQGQEPIDAWALLGTCRLWRMAALPVYSRCMTVCTPGDRGHSYRVRRGLSSAKVAVLGWLPFVRQVVAFVSLQEYLTGGFQLALAKLGNSTSSISGASQLGDIYPFANDVLLRGSRATLRKLVLAVDTSVAGWILAKEFDASTVTRSTQDVHNRLLHAAFKAPQLAQVRIQYPNFSIAKYTPAHMS
ncbi:hypothetical protein BX661DRAFT_205192 [Kickxella alabastrina]|uniref:uncharacterized protein n=1 Tax=Kickxella alabastrina TaxID=61397 RepID=UPI00222058A7|nr:uncharacterized protein BX661DRAFT_205192 [Kickxella alabastrina]KAI7828376.1 hypothetical protein BX661DRAFT_205192 [Kickxella alabastrina]